MPSSSVPGGVALLPPLLVVYGLEAAMRKNEEDRRRGAECRGAIRRGSGHGHAAIPGRSLCSAARALRLKPARLPHAGAARVQRLRGLSGPRCASFGRNHCTLSGLRADTGIGSDRTVRSAGRCDSKKGTGGYSASARSGYVFFYFGCGLMRCDLRI